MLSNIIEADESSLQNNIYVAWKMDFTQYFCCVGHVYVGIDNGGW